MVVKGGIVINIILATHGHMASGTANTIKILTERDDVYAMDAYVEHDDLEQEIQNMKQWLKKRSNQKTLIFTDLLAGSVNQRITKEFLNEQTFIIAGFNLAILLECIMLKEEVLDHQQLHEIVARARNEIVLVNEWFQERKEEKKC